MTHLVALVSGFGWHVQDLRRASGVVGVAFDPIPFSKVVGRVGRGSRPIEAGGVDLSIVDGVLVRMMPPGSLEQVVFRMDALHRLVRLGVTVMNPPGAVEAAVNKYLASARLDAEGLPVPETWVGESADDAMVAFESLGGDVVVKPLFGSEGRGLVRVSDPELAWRTFRTLERLNVVLYVQKYVRNPGHDVRAFVLGGRLLGAMRRYAAAGEWRTNVAVGGQPEACTLDDEAERLALRSASAIGASMAGVDLLPDLETGRWTILEVNAVPGWKALGAATGIDVAAAILAELRGRLSMSDHLEALTPGRLAQLACVLEASARKPGNVHRFRDFDDTSYLDFLLSAAAIAGPMDRAGASGVGRAILESVESTRRLVATNTNLGMILLLAPMAAVPIGEPLREGLAAILETTTVEDARLAYRAIRLATPGGLGRSDDQDIAEEPTVTLLQAMALAADRDLVARQYASSYADVFDRALPSLDALLRSGRPLETAIIGTYLEFLADHPDTLIARKRGMGIALEASRRALAVLQAGWPNASEPLGAFDDWLRLDGHARNPGATADLTTAALFAAFRDGTITLPLAWS